MVRDSLHRFVFEHSPIRGEIVHLDASWRAVLERRDYPLPLRNALGEMMAAAALLTATLKFEGKLILQIKGTAAVKLLVVECNSNRNMRALAQWDGDIAEGSLADMTGGGQLVMTIDPETGRERYQGIVDLGGASIADALEHYFVQSEQLDTKLWLAADAQQAAGMLLQRLPDQELPDHDAWRRAVRLGETITAGELLALSAKDILHRLYHEEDIRLFSHLPVSFRCSCSRDRVSRVLRMLGADEVRDIVAEQGQVDVACEFCGQQYRYDRVDAEQLFAADVTPATPSILH